MKIVNWNRPTSDGRIAMENAERSFWQSRATKAGKRADLPNLTDLTALAKDIRRAAATPALAAIAFAPDSFIAKRFARKAAAIAALKARAARDVGQRLPADRQDRA